MLYDLIIIGSGPAGCAASIYASRYRLNNLVLGKTQGGTIAYAHKVDNYPGLPGLSGVELMEKIENHVKSLGAPVVFDPVAKLAKTGEIFTVTTETKQSYQAKAVIVATGTERRRLNIPGEKELTGKGVSFCVTCDAPFYRGKTVALVGGSDAACSSAVHLAEFTKKIYLIYRKGCLRAEPFWTQQWESLVSQGKGEAIYNTNLVAIMSQSQLALPSSTVWDKVGAVKLDKPFKDSDILRIDGVFIEIGGVPGTDLVKPLGANLDESGHVKVNEKMETNIPGLFCAGDITDKAKIASQVITACAWGAIAAGSVYPYLKGQQVPKHTS